MVLTLSCCAYQVTATCSSSSLFAALKPVKQNLSSSIGTKQTLTSSNNHAQPQRKHKRALQKRARKIQLFRPEMSDRKIAKIIGGALLLMAVLSGIAIPALGTLSASLGLAGIFLLDILVSFGIQRYHKREKPRLAKTAGAFRLLYTAIFGVGIGYHIMGNVSMFKHFWGIGLITFGIHLITLGILFNNEGGKKWVKILIKSLLITAGIGYIVQYVGILLVPNPAGFAAVAEAIFIVPMILGEVLYAIWMLLKGGTR